MTSKSPLSSQEEREAQVDTAALMNKVALNQDKAAFAELFEYFAPRVKSYMLSMGSDERQAEELAQLTLLQVWRKAQLYNPGKAAVSTWMFRIARNLRIDALRKQKHFFDSDFDFNEIEDDAENAEERIDREQQAKAVRSALVLLSEEQAEIVHLSFFEGLSHGDISERLSLPLGTVKSRLRLAFSKLRKSINPQTGEMT